MLSMKHAARRPRPPLPRRRVGLEQANALYVHAQFGQGFAGDLQQTEVAQAVIQQPADQEFQREVVNPLLDLAIDMARVIHPVLDHVVAGSKGGRFKPVMLKRMVGVLAHRIGEFGEHSGAESSHISVTNKWFLRHRYNLK